MDFAKPADLIAPLLLDATLWHESVGIRVTEVEAYLGADDAAAHSARGRTRANAALFGPPGRLYVYHSYGIHKAGNIVAHPPGGSGGVLLRAGEVIAGLDEVRARRGANIPDHRLASGPGNFGKALGLQITDNSSPISLASEGRFRLQLRPAEQHPDIVMGPRIGITKNADALLRYWLPGDPTVSARKTWAQRWPG
ncbi:DNA-3-methyladenine glycosylase [Staphylococcus chromogenes]|nr:DNA-3-methyladenine glycosylase [Staphylococcus chromogenes]